MLTKLISDFKNARVKLIGEINKFPKNKREEILFDQLNLKDVVAHFAAWDIYFTDSLKLLSAGKAVPYWGKINDCNAKAVSERKNWNWEKIYKEFLKAGEEFIKEYSKTSDLILGKPFWPGKKYTPLRFLEINIDHYLNAQLKEIERLNKKLC